MQEPTNQHRNLPDLENGHGAQPADPVKAVHPLAAVEQDQLLAVLRREFHLQLEPQNSY